MRFALMGLFVIVVVFLGIEIFLFSHREQDLNAQQASIAEELKNAARDQRQLTGEYEYSQHEENLEKELRARFNYKAPGEHIIIIVPPKTTSTPPATP